MRRSLGGENRPRARRGCTLRVEIDPGVGEYVVYGEPRGVVAHAGRVRHRAAVGSFDDELRGWLRQAKRGGDGEG